MSGWIDRAKAESQRTEDTVDQAKQQLREAMAARSGPPASSVEEAEQQTSEIRARIEHDLTSLRSRLPAPGDLASSARSAGIAAAGGLGALAALVVALRARRARRTSRAHEAEVREHAVELARQLARIDLDAVAAEVEREESGSRGPGPWLLGGLAAGAVAAVLARRRLAQEPRAWGPSPPAPGPGRPRPAPEPRVPASEPLEATDPR